MSLRERFEKLAPGERKQVIFLCIMFAVGLYGAAAGYLWMNMFEAEKLADRRENRLKTNIGTLKEPEVSREFSEPELKKLQAEYETYQARLTAIEAHQVPLDSPEPREQLKLALTRLAAQHHVEVLSLKSVVQDAATASAAAKVSPALQHFVSRPYFSLDCRARYQDFIAFTQSLTELPFNGFIRQLLIARSAQDKATTTTGDDHLSIALEFQL